MLNIYKSIDVSVLRENLSIKTCLKRMFYIQMQKLPAVKKQSEAALRENGL